ncbi:MAG: alpha-glucan family phosphorylase [Ectothiorhodospiraceae bacterium]|nr:alpha-glucan family phosphorylase [Ectothiorhodospiraceae bacterium]
MTGTRFTLEVQPQLPKKIARLQELANDLLYTWDRNVRSLFYRLDNALWEEVGHSPKIFLRRVSQNTLEAASHDRIFMDDYHRALTNYDAYRSRPMRSEITQLDPNHDLVAYFCAEFGLHESLPIYSGGLGILAGDHCKAASDLGIPFVAIGLLYRQGYFKQTIDKQGTQAAHYATANFSDLPITPATDAQNKPISVAIQTNGREIHIRVWQARVGRITLYLLDTDHEANHEDDRSITHRLYGGDKNTRIQQEIVLGIGGVRALRALNLRPTVWHINEGHSAFQIMERCRQRINDSNGFEQAFEQVASGTVFTTHTPVPAGHDIFDRGMIEHYLTEFIRELGINIDQFMSLADSSGNEGAFNMTALALRGSRFHNGVSRIHGGMASQMESYIWPQIPADENPISYVTNGVHVPTFLAREWVNLLDVRFPQWRNELNNEDYWHILDEIPDHRYWSLRQSLKTEMLEGVKRRALVQWRRNGCSEAQIKRLLQHIEPSDTDTLIMGFARRFATYKRATLLFADPERLARLINNPERPVVLIFAGKAHPEDHPGQELIKQIHEFSRRPEFEGRILLLEGYDMSLARKLVTGVDVWLNTPEYPMEASGTSGEKAAINGAVNLSVLDGWWGEGFDGTNGWGITPHGPEFDADYRNHEEAQDLLGIIEKEVIPLYYQHNGRGYSEGWVRMSKNSMRTTIPNFNSQRMLMDYIRQFYGPAAKHHANLLKDNAENAHLIANWKRTIAKAWPNVGIRLDNQPPVAVKSGEHMPLRITAKLDGLSATDVMVECLVGTEDKSGNFTVMESYALKANGKNAEGDTLFALDLSTKIPGKQIYKLRIYPYHELLAHRFETGYMIWI